MKLKLLTLAISLSFCMIVLVAVGEFAVRHRERTRETVPGTFEMMYYRHARLGHALIRNNNYYHWIHVNSHGFRGPETSLAAEPGVTRIMAIGASTTFDVGVSGDDRAWPARLERLLNEDPGSGRSFEVLNAGVAGYTMLDYLIRYQTELHAFRPDLVILYGTHNNLFYALLDRGAGPGSMGSDRPDEIPPTAAWKYWLEQNSMLYSKVSLRLHAILFRFQRGTWSQEEIPATFDEVLRRAKPTFARHARGVISAMVDDGIPVLVPRVVHVSGNREGPATDEERENWYSAIPFFSAEEVIRGYREFGDTLAAVAGEVGAVPVDTRGFGVEGTGYYFLGDPIHFNDDGASAFAEAMAEVVRHWFAGETEGGSEVAAAGRE